MGAEVARDDGCGGRGVVDKRREGHNTQHSTTTTTTTPIQHHQHQQHTHPHTTHDAGQLLDHIGGHVNPLVVVEKLPPGLAVPRLRDRLAAVIADFRTQTGLREGCNAVLAADCRRLVAALQRGARRAVRDVYVRLGPGDALRGAGGCSSGGGSGGAGGWVRYSPASGRAAAPVAAEEVPDLAGGGGGDALLGAAGLGVVVGLPYRGAGDAAAAAAAVADGGGLEAGLGGGGDSRAAQLRLSSKRASARAAAGAAAVGDQEQLPSLL